MIHKIINFLDQHRLVLIVLILFVISAFFLGIKSYLFLHHNFHALNCTEKIDEEFCYYKDKIIFSEPDKSKDSFFQKYNDEIEKLQNKYHLDDFNNYTAYYYFTVSKLDYTMHQENKILQDFFKVYVNTYDLETFYFDNNFYFNLFYNYKIY